MVKSCHKILFNLVSCRDQIFNVRQTIAFLSQGTTLEPGTVIMTGTPAGVGYYFSHILIRIYLVISHTRFTRKPAVYLKNGDEVRVSIDGIGTLINRVVEESKARL